MEIRPFCAFAASFSDAAPALEDGVPHEVDATRDVELAHRVGFVDFDGLDAEGEASGDLFIAIAERDETQDFRLAVAQIAFRLAARRPITITIHDFGGQLGSPSSKSVFTLCGAAGPKVLSCSRMPTTGRQKSWQYGESSVLRSVEGRVETLSGVIWITPMPAALGRGHVAAVARVHIVLT